MTSTDQRPRGANSARSHWIETFHPRRGLQNGHVQTIVGNYLRRPAFSLQGHSETVLVDEADGSQVRCDVHLQPEEVRASRLTAVLVHGLEGSSNSGYMRGVAARAWAAGCNVVRMNMRSCGDTESLSPTLYHSGLSADAGHVVEHFVREYGLEQVALVGYSMGGNLVLKLAGEWGKRTPLCAVATVCPAIDLAPGSDAMHEGFNRLYEWHFLRRLKARLRRKAALYPEIYSLKGIENIRTLRQFDDQVVARYCGFAGADDYYHRAASARVVDKIAVPTLILHAADDPFIRLLPETRARIEQNDCIDFVETRHGGHCAYLGPEPGDEIHWAEATVVRYLMRVHSQGEFCR